MPGKRKPAIEDVPPPASAERRARTGLPERRSERAPDALAVVHGEAEMAYRRLHRCANRLARVLIDRGAGPGRLVVIALAPGSGAIAAVLATLKSGAGHRWLDPRQPAGSSAGMFAGTAPVCLITTTDEAPRIPAGGWATLLLDGDDLRTELFAASDAPLSGADRRVPLDPGGPHPDHIGRHENQEPGYQHEGEA